MQIANIKKGQRYLSETEPELGLGVITHEDFNRVTIYFESAKVIRVYSIMQAPLRRITFQNRDQITIKGDHSFVIVDIKEEKALLYYYDGKEWFCETELSSTIRITLPEKRILNFNFDKNDDFELRVKTLLWQTKRLKSPLRGLQPPRIEPFSHQFYIADEISQRINPRIILADEVGLGKTIEAILIIHKMIIDKKASRILIIVPEHLIIQWFHELYSRFNLSFTFLDSKYYENYIKKNPQSNLLEEQQAILCSTLLLKNRRFQKQVFPLKWDVTLFDEAHHILEKSEDFNIIKTICSNSRSLILLSAIPQYPSLYDYFVRLNLVEPHRYPSFEKFIGQMEKYDTIVALADKIFLNKKLKNSEILFLKEHLQDIPQIFIEDNAKEPVIERGKKDLIIKELVDRHGIGRILFRNTRKNIDIFPKRSLLVYPLALLKGHENYFDHLQEEFKSDREGGLLLNDFNYHHDPRILWLINFLKENHGEKVLLIANSVAKVKGIIKALKKLSFYHFTFFHEEMDFLERDKKSALFKRDEDLQLLISSEIGSEGRNFQFLKHLIFFDIPLNIELLEQRIGRLDRIGQKECFFIHLPFVENSPQHIYTKWLIEGINAFYASLQGFESIFEEFGHYIEDLALNALPHRDVTKDIPLEDLITATQNQYQKVKKSLEKGRDRLLEINSFDKIRGDHLKALIEEEDKDRELEFFLDETLERFGFVVSPLEERTYVVSMGSHVKTDAFPGITEEGKTITFDRKKALEREDYLFITENHYLFERIIDLITGSSLGNAAINILTEEKDGKFLYEMVFLLEASLPKDLNVHYYLPPSVIRLVIDEELHDKTDFYPLEALINIQNNAKITISQEIKEKITKYLSHIIKSGYNHAEKEGEKIIAEAVKSVTTTFTGQINRLQYLKKVNDHIKEEEITLLEEQLVLLKDSIKDSRLRLDAIRIHFAP